MTRSDDLHRLPTDLPIPADDGAARHLAGMTLPDIELPSTSGKKVNLARLGTSWTVVYCYPRTGLPGQNPPGGLDEWNAIPGARGCTPQSCSYRDHYAALTGLGARVFGLSTQTSEYQKEMVERLHLPFDVLSDHELRLTQALRLPTFHFGGQTMTKRCTLLIKGDKIEKCFYPVFPPDSDAEKVLDWLKGR
ncbi:MAG: peroxiredoxin [Elusimicrobia bacterium]|nr:peroxiredoxin [Elusimicrobiota bacterium]